MMSSFLVCLLAPLFLTSLPFAGTAAKESRLSPAVRSSLQHPAAPASTSSTADYSHHRASSYASTPSRDVARHSRPTGYGLDFGYGDLQAAADGGGYGYHAPGCDCSAFNLLALLSGGAALAALGLFVVLQVQAGGGRQSSSSWWPLSSWQLPEQLQLALAEVLPAEQLADRITSATCDAAELIRNRQPLTSSARPGQPLTSLVQPGQLLTSSARSDGCQCFGGVVGSLAGFAALAGLLAFALQLAVAAGGGRALPGNPGNPGNTGNPGNPDRYPRYMSSPPEEVTSQNPPHQQRDLSCVPFHLCHVNQRARALGTSLYTVIRLGSLPVSWALSRTEESRDFGDLCAALRTAEDGLCHRRYPHCA